MNYIKQANDFINKYGITIKANLIGKGISPLFKDNHKRDMYDVTILRNGKSMRVKFTNSAHDSERGRKPSNYTILCCLIKDDPGTFEDFCGNYGYDTDSHKALETYISCQQEWKDVMSLFGDIIKQLRKIQ